MNTPAPALVDQSVVLLDEEVDLARTAVKHRLAKIRANHRHDVRRGNPHFARTNEDRFDDYLELYERLGGNPDDIRDIDRLGS